VSPRGSSYRKIKICACLQLILIWRNSKTCNFIIEHWYYEAFSFMKSSRWALQNYVTLPYILTIFFSRNFGAWQSKVGARQTLLHYEETKFTTTLDNFTKEVGNFTATKNNFATILRGPSSGRCALCSDLEDTAHIFFLCPLAEIHVKCSSGTAWVLLEPYLFRGAL
jgi:hypothetical protein